MDWFPTFSKQQGPIYLQIVDAISADIASGRLRRGQQMPTHRSLAKALEIDLTTVTRAYGEARRRGMLDAQVGRGTFVSETTARATAHLPFPLDIDLSLNVPPQPLEANLDMRIAQGLAAVEREAGFSAYLNYRRTGGSEEECEVAATWLRPRLPHAGAGRVVIYPGNQAILFNALLALTKPGDIVLTEELTFPGMIAAGKRLGLRLVGVKMDAGGVCSDALADACKQHRPKAVYLVPTQHNPTTATLSAERRREIADILRDADTFLIEDDAYGLLEPSASPIANMIPERAYLAVGLAKCIAPALRTAYLLAPDENAAQSMREHLQATSLMQPSLMVALVDQWLRGGIADQIILAIRHEAAGRQKLAATYLKGFEFAAPTAGHHLWLSLPPPWDQIGFQSYTARFGLALVGAGAFTVGARVPNAARLCLGAARNRVDLAQALQFVAETLKPPAERRHIV
jgi:DNA-binding transcriptional MocR family regulator